MLGTTRRGVRSGKQDGPLRQLGPRSPERTPRFRAGRTEPPRGAVRPERL